MRIWVIDDEPGILQVVETALTCRGHQVTTYASAKLVGDAIASQCESIPDLVLIDVMLGPEDGLALAQRLHAVWPTVSVVMMSGDEVPLPGELPLSTRWLKKPFRLQKLTQTVEHFHSG